MQTAPQCCKRHLLSPTRAGFYRCLPCQGLVCAELLVLVADLFECLYLSIASQWEHGGRMLLPLWVFSACSSSISGHVKQPGLVGILLDPIGENYLQILLGVNATISTLG